MAKSEKEVRKEKVKKPGLIKRFTAFVKGVGAELKKVTWPTKNELMQHTSVVLGIVFILTLIVYVIDAGLGGLLALIIR
ncbi:preprotein translocase subunit SecE [Alkalibacter saccharofermentans]|jgi:preprotein translocase subunit SecE|uniref:Protein translocase subunit SecE n=1 Tax=Alkalibacter saccharofermentans DSM 14828 TaxID=1120975 RepID=A0A1M5A2J1_9FIRM|nr:preprotein translocase subunit SecE [Alkalibacter saccharofermentans]SHF24540.1 preprotein translocase subunit SecE [Alkalibacter saccharofermentans DSM 14828]